MVFLPLKIQIETLIQLWNIFSGMVCNGLLFSCQRHRLQHHKHLRHSLCQGGRKLTTIGSLWKMFFFQLKEELKEAGDEDAAFKTCNVFFIKTKLSSLYLFVWRMGLFFCVGAFFLLSYCWVSRNWLRLPHFLFLGHSFRQVSCSLF